MAFGSPPPPDYVPPAQLPPNKPQRCVRVVLTGGERFVDFDIDDAFNLLGFVGSIRGAGYLLNEKCYIPADHIESMFIFEKAKAPDHKQPGVVLELVPKAPA